MGREIESPAARLLAFLGRAQHTGQAQLRLESTKWYKPSSVKAYQMVIPYFGKDAPKRHALLRQRCIELYCSASAEAYRTDPSSFGWSLLNPSLALSLSQSNFKFVFTTYGRIRAS
ncbi:hypothetical protein ACFX1X_036365 [Malus domestica]